MIDGYLLNMRVFNKVNDDKHQALKPLEEAAEIFGAWQARYNMRFVSGCVWGVSQGSYRRMRGHRASSSKHAGCRRRNTR